MGLLGSCGRIPEHGSDEAHRKSEKAREAAHELGVRVVRETGKEEKERSQFWETEKDTKVPW